MPIRTIVPAKIRLMLPEDWILMALERSLKAKYKWSMYISTGTRMSHDIQQIDGLPQFRVVPTDGFHPLPMRVLFVLQNQLRELLRDPAVRIVARHTTPES